MNVFFFTTLIMIIIGVAFSYIAWCSAKEWGTSSLLDARGQRTQGTVIEYRSSVNRGATYFVTYRFRPHDSHNLVSYDKEQQVSWRHIKRLNKDTKVNILYLRENPKISKLAGDDNDNTLRDTLTIIPLVGLVIFPPIISASMALIWIVTFLIKRFS